MAGCKVTAGSWDGGHKQNAPSAAHAPLAPHVPTRLVRRNPAAHQHSTASTGPHMGTAHDLPPRNNALASSPLRLLPPLPNSTRAGAKTA
jgi:hypothetical protein